MKSVSLPVSPLMPRSDTISEAPGVTSGAMRSRASCGIWMRSRASLAEVGDTGAGAESFFRGVGVGLPAGAVLNQPVQLPGLVRPAGCEEIGADRRGRVGDGD